MGMKYEEVCIKSGFVTYDALDTMLEKAVQAISKSSVKINPIIEHNQCIGAFK